MKIEIEKSRCQVIDLLAKNRLIIQVGKEGVYKYFMHRESVGINGLSVDQNHQIEEEGDA